VALANELVREDFHGKDQTKRRCDDVVRKWRALLDLLEKRRRVLDLLGDLIQMVRDADSIYADLKNLEVHYSRGYFFSF
jgi:spectrin beta